jgi:hypothetical protein
MITKESLMENLEAVYSMQHLESLLKQNGDSWGHEHCNSREIRRVFSPFFSELQNNLNNNLRLYLEQEGFKLKDAPF